MYRGKAMPKLNGVYLYGDFAMGTVWGLRFENGQVTAYETLVKGNALRQISSFGEDKDGEIYLLSFDGSIYAVIETPR